MHSVAEVFGYFHQIYTRIQLCDQSGNALNGVAVAETCEAAETGTLKSFGQVCVKRKKCFMLGIRSDDPCYAYCSLC